jgi:serine/threonine protein phosphatase PrpC
MSRSFGDQVASTIGVISVPECREVTLSSADKVIVLASDGVWEFTSNEEVANIVYPYYI